MAQWRNTAERWGTIARLLHWGIAALILLLMIVGMIMGEMENSPEKFMVYTYHKSFGLLALALVICRIVWRLADPRPPLPATTPKAQVLLAELVHWALYGLMIAVPFSGYAAHSLRGFPLNLFGVDGLAVPSLITAAPEAAQELAHDAGEVHETLAFLLIAVVLLHAAAAIAHHVVKKDPILARMTPFIRSPKA